MERSKTSGDDAEALNEHYMIETLDQELEKEFSQQNKDASEEANLEKHRSREERVDTNMDVEILDEPPLIGQDNGLIQEEGVPLERKRKRNKKRRFPKKGAPSSDIVSRLHKRKKGCSKKRTSLERMWKSLS